MLLYGHETGGKMRAFREAGYKADCNHPTVQLAKLMRSPDIQSALAAAQFDMAEKFEVSQDRVLRELVLLAFSDISHYKMDQETGELIVNPDEDVNPAVSRAISSVEYTTVTDGDRVTKKVRMKLWDKNNALTLLMKYLGMLVDRNLNVNVNAKMSIDQAREIIASAQRPSVADARNLQLPATRPLDSLPLVEEPEAEVTTAGAYYEPA